MAAGVAFVLPCSLLWLADWTELGFLGSRTPPPLGFAARLAPQAARIHLVMAACYVTSSVGELLLQTLEARTRARADGRVEGAAWRAEAPFGRPPNTPCASASPFSQWPGGEGVDPGKKHQKARCLACLDFLQGPTPEGYSIRLLLPGFAKGHDKAKVTATFSLGFAPQEDPQQPNSPSSRRA